MDRTNACLSDLKGRKKFPRTVLSHVMSSFSILADGAVADDDDDDNDDDMMMMTMI